jgi:putative ABC transport system permease protein
MLRNYLLTTYRNILRRPGFSLINISGLAIGLAACLIIMLYVFDELSFDRFHENADRIYRVTVHGKFGGNEFHSTYTPAPFAAALKQEFPEVEHVTRLLSGNQHSIREGENTWIEDRFLYADSSFFEVFSFKLIEGNPGKALVEPRSIVLTKSTAKRYFGDEDPMGKTIIENNIHYYTVTGIVEDAPANSHFKFNVVASFNSLAWHANTSWFNQSAHTYMVLAPGTNAAETEQKLDPLLYRNIREQMKDFLGISLEEFAESGQTYGYKLQPMMKIHLHSQLDGELEANGNITYVYLFSIIAVFILLIACINYMNLSTARSSSRAKEVGIRKVLGSSRGDLIRQFLGESVLFSLLAMILAVFLIEISLPFFNQIANKQLSLNFESSAVFLAIIPLFVILTGLIAGSYPAFYLSGYQPLQIIKGHLFKGVTKSQLRSLLVLLQYSVSIILLVSTFVVYLQLAFIQDKNMGYNKDSVIVIKRVHGLGKDLQVFKQNILQHPKVVNASYTRDLPGDDFSSNSIGVSGQPLEDVNLMMMMYADYDLIETLGMEMIEGRWFSKEYGTDSMAVILNETAARAVGITDFRQEKIIRHATPPNEHFISPIIGIVKDFHFESLHRGIRPMAIYLRNEGWFNRMAVKLKGTNYEESVNFLEEQWDEMNTGQPFEYTTLDANMEGFYENERKTRVLYTIFSMLALFVASLGLFGLAAYTTESRTKEISIRKVLGAGETGIVMMLSREFAKWVLMANIIAWPLAWVLMDNWLSNFAYRISMPWEVFIAASVITFFIALLTVFYQSLKAARTNPSEALNYE